MATDTKPQQPTPLIFAGRTIRKLRFGRELSPELAAFLDGARRESREALRHARAVRHLDGSDTPESARELCDTHDQLRGAVIHAGRLIRKLNFGRQDCRELALLRRVLREARAVRRSGV